MRKLGLVGGMGPESTMPYYHDIVYGVQKRLGEKSFPNLTIESVDVFKVLGYCSKNEYEELKKYLLNAINNLAAAGADFAALSANTAHIVFEELQKESPIPIISIVEATSEKVKSLGFNKIGLLGTIFTMNGEFFKKPFIDKGIEIVTPKDNYKEYIDKKISEELEFGIVNKDTLNKFLIIVEEMKVEENIQAIILGCTELPLLFTGVKTAVPCIDTVKVHVDKLVDEILK